jgi:plasmid replication initiation protein
MEKVKNEIIENPKGKTARVANDLARAKLLWTPKTVWDLRIFYLVASKVGRDDTNFFNYKIPISELKLPSEKVQGSEFKKIESAISNLVKAAVIIKDEKRIEGYSLFQHIKYTVGTGFIDAQINDEMKPFFLYIDERFTLVQMEEYLQLSTRYAQLLFTNLKSLKGKGEVEISLKELHKILKPPKSCITNFYEFNRRILTPTINQINKNTTLRISYLTNVQNGKKVEKIKFIFHEQLDLPFKESKL